MNNIKSVSHNNMKSASDIQANECDLDKILPKKHLRVKWDIDWVRFVFKTAAEQ